MSIESYRYSLLDGMDVRITLVATSYVEHSSVISYTNFSVNAVACPLSLRAVEICTADATSMGCFDWKMVSLTILPRGFCSLLTQARAIFPFDIALVEIKLHIEVIPV